MLNQLPFTSLVSTPREDGCMAYEPKGFYPIVWNFYLPHRANRSSGLRFVDVG